MNIDEMEAGRELDALVAKALGWRKVIQSEHIVMHDGRQVSCTFGPVGIPPKACINSQRVSVPGWSTSERAWEVADRVCEILDCFYEQGCDKDGYYILFIPRDRGSQPDTWPLAIAKTRAEAICFAAIEVMRVSE